MTPARDNIILVVVNLDPLYTQSGCVEVPVEDFGEMAVESLRSARSADRRALRLARAAQLRRACIPVSSPRTSSASGGCNSAALLVMHDRNRSASNSR